MYRMHIFDVRLSSEWALREPTTCKNIFILGDGSARFKFYSPFSPHGLLPQWGSCHIFLQIVLPQLQSTIKITAGQKQ